MNLALSRELVEELCGCARASFPEECCGFVIERDGGLTAEPVTNVQNKLHDIDPEQFPRTAATAYTMGREQVPVVLGHERGELVIRAIYHSHPQHASYFSDEDKRNALGGASEPVYPDAAQIVISVIDGKVREVKAFGWSDAARDFVEVGLDIA